MPKAAEFATLKVVDAGGKTIKEDQCSTDDKHEGMQAFLEKRPPNYSNS